ncbi:MAG: ATP-binding protein [Bacteroidota bacterium]|nr:ATP-binding protein [Bacteroidota bacterium]
MSKMLAEIRRIVSEDISNRVTQYDVLFEAITNSIHANATKIKCKLHSYDNPEKENGIDLVPKRIDTITIIDNGDGLNEHNYASFCKYRTEYKKELGGKGVGRFVYLKVYENVSFKSQIKSEQEVKSFKFNLDFDTEDVIKTPTGVAQNETELFFSTLTNQYKNFDKHIDRRIDLDLNLIKNKILLNLIPTLFFYKKKQVSIVIEIQDTTTGKILEIIDSDIPDLEEKKFLIKDKNLLEYGFVLNHGVKKEEGTFNTYYCANNRTVCEFSEKDFKLSLPYGYSGYFLLESSYFDKKVNHERNDFDIYPTKTDFVSPVSWEMINTNLKAVISEIVKEGIPETQKINKEKLEAIQEERPYLISYIDEEDIDIAGFLDKSQIIEKAKKKFDKEKEKLLTSHKKESYTDEDLREAIEITQNELVSYINDRSLVLERLRSLVDKKEKVESVIHNLFMERYTDDDYYSVGKNNLWLLDDRFTTYSYAASEKRIKEVLKSIGEVSDDSELEENKPDLSLFFSHNPNNPKSLKSVLVEIKPFDFNSKSDRKKFAGIQQLVDYVEAFKSKENIEEIFAFLITDIDDKLADRLKKDDYTPLFSLNAPIFHRFYKELGISIYVISAKTLIIDAEARNKVFLEIIRKNSRLNNILKDKSTLN